MRALTPAILILIVCAFNSNSPGRAGQPTPCGADRTRAPLGSAHMRTTLYFGLSHPNGSVSESRWRAFLRNEVTPRFPEGLTVWEANGQWRRADGEIGRERAKVLLLVHEETPAVRSTLATIIDSYKRAFQQESVLWETALCAPPFKCYR